MAWKGDRRGEVRTECWWGSLKERALLLYDLAVDGKIILKWVLKEFDRVVWAGMINIRTWTNKVVFLAR